MYDLRQNEILGMTYGYIMRSCGLMIICIGSQRVRGCRETQVWIDDTDRRGRGSRRLDRLRRWSHQPWHDGADFVSCRAT